MIRSPGVLLALALCLLGLAWAWHCRRPAPRRRCTHPIVRSRYLKPRTPADCPLCRQQEATPAPPPGPAVPVRPWREVKSRRGRPKRIATEGFACPQSTCRYYHLTDAQVHALVGDGTHGKQERIQTFRCQACGGTFSARRGTPLYRLKTASRQVGQVLTALAEGLDVAAAARVFGHDQATITTWLTRAGQHCARLHSRWLRHLHLPHVQLDELRTRLRDRAQVLWLWVAVDPASKLIPGLQLGPRTQAAAYAFVHQLCPRLAPDCLPVFTSDGLNYYYYALTAHFGCWVQTLRRRRRQWQVAPGLLYGQVRKVYRGRRLVRVTHVMRCGTRAALRLALLGLGLSGQLNTAFVERVNLTLRRSVAALARRTWATRRQAGQLLAHLEWWRGYYHFCRPHASLRVALASLPDASSNPRSPRYGQRTPAMAAGLTSRRWRVVDLFTLPLLPAPDSAG